MSASFLNNYFSGISGLVLPVPQALYPEKFQGKTRLEYYASIFNSIEINSSFKKLPGPSTIIKWRETVPDTFQFTFKLSKSVSHSQGLKFDSEEIMLFMTTVNNVGKKKGCILVQLPPSLQLDKIDQLEKLFKLLCAMNKKKQWKLAAEFRNKIWYNDKTFELLRQYNFSFVVQDLAASATPLLAVNGTVYLRLHGTERNYRGSYDDKLLSKYAQHIKQWLSEGKSVYCYFNNTLGNAFNNLQTLDSFIRV